MYIKVNCWLNITLLLCKWFHLIRYSEHRSLAIGIIDSHLDYSWFSLSVSVCVIFSIIDYSWVKTLLGLKRRPLELGHCFDHSVGQLWCRFNLKQPVGSCNFDSDSPERLRSPKVEKYQILMHKLSLKITFYLHVRSMIKLQLFEKISVNNEDLGLIFS